MKGKSTKSALLMSFTSLLLCFAMLIGSTFAWFTDSVTSGINQIKAGNLDVELYHAVGAVSDASDKVTEATKLFNVEHWEPGVVAYENFLVKNVGTLALKYQLAMTVGEFNTVDGHSLKEVLKVAVVPNGFSGDRAAAQGLSYTTLENFSTSSKGALLPNTEGDIFGVVIYWQPNVMNDNDYNLNNGKTATVVDGKFSADALGIELGIQLLAQQLPHEEDSFNKFYDLQDDDVILPDWSGESEEKPLDETNGATLEVMVNDIVRATAEVEAGTKINGSELTQDEKLKLTIEPDNTPNGITVDTGNSVTTFDVSLVKVVTTTATEGGETTKEDVKVTAADKPVLVSLDIGIVDLVDFYHHGEKLTKVNDKNSVDVDKYYYEIETGTVYFKTKSFSPFASVYKFAGGIGDENHPYLIANRDQMQAITTEYAAYKYYKVADGVTTMDCTGWNQVELFGSFDGNGVKFTGIDNKLFRFVGKMGDGTAGGLATWDTKAAYLKNFEANFNMDAALDIASGMIYQINGNNETILENITISGKMAGGSNSGAFFTYTGPNLNDTPVTGMQQKVTLKNCKVTATLFCTSGSFGVVAGYPHYSNPDITITVDNPDTIWAGTGYTASQKVQANAWKQNDYGFTAKDCNKLNKATIQYDSTNNQYTCTKTENATRMDVFISAQLTETDAQGNKTPVSGITLSLGKLPSVTFAPTDGPVKICDSFSSVDFKNKQASYYGNVADGVLHAATAGTTNYTIGSIKLAVAQYDADGKLVSTGSFAIAKREIHNGEWAINP